MMGADPRFARTLYLVEASPFESMTLWRTYYRRIPWEDELVGALAIVGYIDSRAVCVSFLWTKIYGFYVCFYNPTSEVIDYAMVNEYLKNVAKEPVEENRVTDAANFAHCVEYCRWVNESVQSSSGLRSLP